MKRKQNVKKCIKFIAVCLAVGCAFLLGIQWKAKKMEELSVIKEKLEIEIANWNWEKGEMSFEIERLIKEVNEKQTSVEEYEERIKELQEDAEWLRDMLAEGNISKEMTADKMVVETNDAFYKMFYGKWRISSVIEGRYFEEYDNYYDEEKAKRYLGKTVEYSSECVKVDGEQVLVTPAYAYAIVPANKYYWYVAGYDPQEDFVDYEKNDYFVYVIAGNAWNKGEHWGQDIFKYFFVVDDDRMVLAAGGVFFWMDRVEHEEDYEVRETSQDYNW